MLPLKRESEAAGGGNEDSWNSSLQLLVPLNRPRMEVHLTVRRPAIRE